MSTKIYNGIKFKSNNIGEVLQQLQSVKEEALKICGDMVSEDDIEAYIEFCINKMPCEKDTSEDKKAAIYFKKNDIFDIRKQISDNVRKREELALLFFNAEFFVYVVPYKNNLYGARFSPSDKYTRLLDPYVEDYHYQNQTDKPDDISDDEWDGRRDIWNEIFDKFWRFTDVGFRYDLVTFDDLCLLGLYSKIKRVVDKMKNNELNLYKMGIIKDAFNEILEEAATQNNDPHQNRGGGVAPKICKHDFNNFIHEYKPNTNNNAKLISINEINAKTLISKHGKNGFIVISPCRGYADFNIDPNKKGAKQELAAINNQRIRNMIQQIKNSGYSYTPVYGGFIENIGTDDEQNVYERSFVIYNNKKASTNSDISELIEFGKNLAKEYNQDSFLAKIKGQKPKYITKDGDVDIEFNGDATFNDFSQEYFTDLHKNTDKYSNEPNRKPTRFSYVESYLNPAPQCYSERHVRSLNNEVFLTESSINRLEHWIKSKDIAGITAWRNKLENTTNSTLKDKNPNEPYSIKENKLRNRNLKAILLRLGYGVINVRGSYIENYKSNNPIESQEESFIVVNINDDTNFYRNIFKLSEYYNQDSFLFKKKNSDNAILVGTNTNEFPGYNNSIEQGGFIKNVSSEFMSRIGNKGFAFADKDDVSVDKTKTFTDRKQERIHNMNTFKTESISSKKAIASIADHIIKEINITSQNENESIALMERMGISPKSSNVMAIYYNRLANDNPPQPLNEETINRIIDKHGKNGFIIISANRSDLDKSTNKENTLQLIDDIKKSGYSYFPVYGGYRGIDNVIDNYEPSFLVANYNKDGGIADFEKLKELAVQWCGKYNQDSVLIKSPNNPPIYLNKLGQKANETESNSVKVNDPTQEYFTALYKKPDATNRFTYDIKFKNYECFYNPNPCTLNEMQARDKSGEILVKYGNISLL